MINQNIGVDEVGHAVRREKEAFQSWRMRFWKAAPERIRPLRRPAVDRTMLSCPLGKDDIIASFIPSRRSSIASTSLNQFFNEFDLNITIPCKYYTPIRRRFQMIFTLHKTAIDRVS